MCCWNVYCVGLAFLWVCVNLNVVRAPDRQLLHPAGPAPLLAPGHPLQALPLPLRLHRPAQRHQVSNKQLLKVSTKFHAIHEIF